MWNCLHTSIGCLLLLLLALLVCLALSMFLFLEIFFFSWLYFSFRGAKWNTFEIIWEIMLLYCTTNILFRLHSLYVHGCRYACICNGFNNGNDNDADDDDDVHDRSPSHSNMLLSFPIWINTRRLMHTRCIWARDWAAFYMPHNRIE